MGTGNFYNKNASMTFAVLMSYEDQKFDDDGNEIEGETETRTCDENDMVELFYLIKEKIEKVAKEKKWKYDHDGKTYDHERNFGGITIGELFTWKKFGDIEVYAKIKMIFRSGYYEGGNIDWEFEFEIDGYCTDEIDFNERFFWGSEMRRGMQVIQCKNAEKWASRMNDLLVEEVEKVYTEVSRPLVLLGRASNGETFYKEVEKEA